MDVVPRVINVGNEPVNRPVIIGQQLDTVSAEGFEVAQPGGKRDNGSRVRRQFWMSVWPHTHLRLGRADALGGAHLPFETMLWNVDAPEQGVKSEARPGEQKNEQQPGAGGG